jgi:hypothetical protein
LLLPLLCPLDLQVVMLSLRLKMVPLTVAMAMLRTDGLETEGVVDALGGAVLVLVLRTAVDVPRQAVGNDNQEYAQNTAEDADSDASVTVGRCARAE